MMTLAAAESHTSGLQWWGAFAFGIVIGWFLYFLNRYRKNVSLADLTTVIGAIGGAAVLALFPAKTDLFGAYGVGLAAGFFGYFLVLVVLVTRSQNFGIDYLIDGRRKNPAKGYGHGTGVDRPMATGDDESKLPLGS
jgi:hypothetical protein